jgi:hypothetical protein
LLRAQCQQPRNFNNEAAIQDKRPDTPPRRGWDKFSCQAPPIRAIVRYRPKSPQAKLVIVGSRSDEGDEYSKG